MAGPRPHPPRAGPGVIRILVVDDQALVRSGFHLILDSEPDFEVVGEAADGQEAIDLTRRLRPDVVLMDVRMPRMDGVEATRTVVADGASRVLILTTFDLDEHLFAAVRAGASGFLLKDVPPDDLALAVRAVARGDALIEPRMTRRLLEEFARQPSADRAPRTPAGVGEQLTARELEVFQAVARGHSNAEIAEELYISETTVKTHVAHILTKLDLRDRIQAVVLAYESGLLPPGG
ncbi:MAG: response regulator transcription factor [Actinobacteria bacterium]|nr:MAG: response regulator transcription factor [Actinomycetota bacterium]